MSVKHLIALLAFALLIGSGLAKEVRKNTNEPYWAYQPVKEVPVPQISDPFVRNPIDAFILEGLQKNQLTPNAAASIEQLQRRLSYDTTGLPPQESDLNWPDLVDQYLASAHFGEKFASHWLDLVRYAETNGFERDSLKPEIWRYRDYVIDSFNKDKPYNRFLMEQLAGDQLPDPTFEAQIATGFMTLMQRDDEPADRPQAHADVISDIVDISGEAFMGTTMACAKCHDHKGDPITQADYFSTMAFFDGIRQDMFKSPNHTWVDPQVTEKREQQRRDNHLLLENLWKSVDRSLIDPLLKKANDPQSVSTDWQRSFRIPTTPDWSLPSFPADQAGFRKTDKWPGGKPIALRSEFGLQEIPQQFLAYVKGELDRLEIFLNGTRVHEGLSEKIHGEHFIPLPIAELTTGKNVIGIVASSRQRSIEIRITRAPLHDLSDQQLALIHPESIARAFGADFANKMHPLQQQRQELEKPIDGIQYHGVHEDQNIPTPQIHIRGNVHAQGDAVPISFPKVLDPSESTPERTRYAFAKWITDPAHPLTARVWVNRLWQYAFGKGLVESANDFGTLGTGVSNQALLDWLASELVRSNWSTKHMLRLMFNSSTYQLSSSGLNDTDPENRLHWKYSSRRLTAEEIWDTYLILTGKMNFDFGGPSVRPKMPDAVLATASRPSAAWPMSPGDSANRRAVYIHVKRSIKLPILANFDAPERDFSCPSRFSTTVPTQALTMLNSERMNDFATLFSSRLNGSLEEKISQAFKLATSREIDGGEMHELTNLAKDLQEKYQVPDDQLMARLCLLILNLNETIYLD